MLTTKEAETAHTQNKCKKIKCNSYMTFVQSHCLEDHVNQSHIRQRAAQGNVIYILQRDLTHCKGKTQKCINANIRDNTTDISKALNHEADDLISSEDK